MRRSQTMDPKCSLLGSELGVVIAAPSVLNWPSRGPDRPTGLLHVLVFGPISPHQSPSATSIWQGASSQCSNCLGRNAGAVTVAASFSCSPGPRPPAPLPCWWCRCALINFCSFFPSNLLAPRLTPSHLANWSRLKRQRQTFEPLQPDMRYASH
jgi:hypothetical protein